MTTDTEQALRDAVVEAATGWAVHAGKDAHDKLLDAALALRDHLAKTSTPEPTLWCEPPEEFRGEPWHWLVGSSGKPRPGQWDTRDGGWRLSGCDWQSVSQITDWGWKWHSVASPARPDTRVEATDEAILDYAVKSDWLGTAHLPRIRQLLAHFSAPPAISNETLRELYSLAHKNAPDQFVTEAKGMVGR